MRLSLMVAVEMVLVQLVELRVLSWDVVVMGLVNGWVLLGWWKCGRVVDFRSEGVNIGKRKFG